MMSVIKLDFVKVCSVEDLLHDTRNAERSKKWIG